ncbi:FAD-dependent oxidoreductase [Actinoplanes bogorensis]|uniref:FAD-dependent oxidoreductase n=1 Tax=Paractinoplanes bogorensis TaxID=1610840 RepID=A0ABS5Z0M4_9ACTN|nr:FAD-dependent oxidoreductase [Actinoplanes bogorensis]MBU2668901.1 FAD-dependent oxidoreductase [Actinoplanes bogorensis]
MSSVLVVGAGLGGVRTAQTLRRLGHRGPVTLLGAEPSLPYDRPPLSKAGLAGERPPVWLATSPELSAAGIVLHTGVTVLSLSPTTVTTSSGSFSYDQLVIATGAEPRRLPVPQPPHGVHVLRTLADATRLRQVLAAGSRLVVVGAGVLGCEVAATARSLGVEVTLVEADTAPMRRLLGAGLGERLAAVHRAQGVDVRCGSGVTAIRGDSAVTGVELADGTVVPADNVVVAIGAVPRTDWLRDSGLTLADGVVCDESLRAAPNVWAVGDVCRWTGTDGVSRRSEHWTNAGNQAEAVAAAIVSGRPTPYESVPWMWSDQYHLKITCLGDPADGDDVRVTPLDDGDRLKAVFSRAGIVSAVAGFSAGGAVLRLRGALGKPLTEVAA